ncbi:MAG: hypothetical protein QF410_13140 [Planctomycetota bacterium]|nr:hypothetical protein [Planctomycetota bacterium]MDP6761530.1 hypothetical protein [Planctomycetota bacterium]
MTRTPGETKGHRTARCAAILALLAAVSSAPRGAGAAEAEDPVRGQDPPADPAPSLAPRKAVDGLRGMVTHSTLRFVGHERPHALAAVFVFPDRARWRIEPAGGDEGARRMRFRHGRRAFGLEPGQAVSRALEGTEATECLLQMELRRAATLWPHGFAWRGEGRLRTAEPTSGGKLVALLDAEEELPVELSSLRPDGRPLESLREIRWRDPDADGRRWPASWDLLVEGRTVWSETITGVDTTTRYLDAYFLPADRREAAAGQTGRRVLAVDMPRRVQRRFPLAGDSWATARERAAALAAQWRAREGAAALEEHATIELDPRGRPAAVLLRLADPLAAAPEGWSTRPGCPGLAAQVEGLERVDGALLRRLGQAAPAGAEPGAPLARIGSTANAVQVLLPLRPAAP